MPSSGLPAYTPDTITTSFPWMEGGKLAAAGAVHAATSEVTSSAAILTHSRHCFNTFRVDAIGYIENTAATAGPTGCKVNSKEVTTPKFPPPPRSAQNRSAFSLLLAVRTAPSAVTTSAEMRLSQLRPYLFRSQPIPPPNVRPDTPVCDTIPPGVAREKACVSRSTSAHVAPAWTHAIRRLRSTMTLFICERSITRPSSQIELPATLCPPPRTAISNLCRL